MRQNLFLFRCRQPGPGRRRKITRNDRPPRDLGTFPDLLARLRIHKGSGQAYGAGILTDPCLVGAGVPDPKNKTRAIGLVSRAFGRRDGGNGENAPAKRKEIAPWVVGLAKNTDRRLLEHDHHVAVHRPWAVMGRDPPDLGARRRKLPLRKGFSGSCRIPAHSAICRDRFGKRGLPVGGGHGVRDIDGQGNTGVFRTVRGRETRLRCLKTPGQAERSRT